MIFVTLGNVPIPFIRLAKKVDEIAEKMNEDIVIQHGHTEYPFKNVRKHKFLSSNEMERLITDASFIISHGGYGTISECLMRNKKVIAVPRILGEHNHSQEELVRALEAGGYIIGVYNTEDLEGKIRDIDTFVPKLLKKGNAGKVINEFMHTSLIVGKQ